MLIHLNLRRLALSMGIIGAIITPLLTGSLRDFGSSYYTEDDENRYLIAHNMDPYTCLIERLHRQVAHDAQIANDAVSEHRICNEVGGLVWQNRVVKWHFDGKVFGRFLMTVIFGFLVPFVVVLIVPRIAKAYFRWVTTPPN